jgi:hypothetical protein
MIDKLKFISQPQAAAVLKAETLISEIESGAQCLASQQDQYAGDDAKYGQASRDRAGNPDA